MEIQKVTDTAFAKYGKVMSDIPVERILKEMEHTPLPEDVIYVPSVEALEVLPDAVAVREKGFGGLPIQIGYCNGSNVKLNALEYHRSSEIDIAVTDLILLLGCQQDLSLIHIYMMENHKNITEKLRQKRMVQVNILSTPLQEQGLKFMHRSMQILQAMM